MHAQHYMIHERHRKPVTIEAGEHKRYQKAHSSGWHLGLELDITSGGVSYCECKIPHNRWMRTRSRFRPLRYVVIAKRGGLTVARHKLVQWVDASHVVHDTW